MLLGIGTQARRRRAHGPLMHAKDVCVCVRSGLARIALIYNRVASKDGAGVWSIEYVNATYLRRGMSIALQRSAKCASEDVREDAECATRVVEVARYSAIVVGAENADWIVWMVSGLCDGLALWAMEEDMA